MSNKKTELFHLALTIKSILEVNKITLSGTDEEVLVTATKIAKSTETPKLPVPEKTRGILAKVLGLGK